MFYVFRRAVGTPDATAENWRVAMASVNPFLCIVIACVVVMSAFVSW